MANALTLNADRIKILALGEVTTREVFEYDQAGNRTSVRRLGPTGKPLWSVGPLAVELAGKPLGQVRVQTETPDVLATASMGTRFTAPNGEVTIRNNQQGFDLNVAILVPEIKDAGTEKPEVGLPTVAGKAAA